MGALPDASAGRGQRRQSNVSQKDRRGDRQRHAGQTRAIAKLRLVPAQQFAQRALVRAQGVAAGGRLGQISLQRGH